MALSRLELEKAIENGESIWQVLYRESYELKTSEHSNKFISRSDDYCYSDKKGVDRYAPLDMLYKTKAEAEHYLHHANITRIETLPFVTWEEFKDRKMVEFYSIDKKEIILRYDMWTHYIILELGPYDKKWWDSTEQNFYKAYDECVRLFKGE